MSAKPDPKDFVLRGKTGETVVRPPGSLMGYDFVIEECSNCTIFLLDTTAQVQIDDCVDCTIVLGPVDGSAFFRDCANLKVACVVRQLRTRDCHDCHFNLHCATDPIVELSANVTFSEWDCAYAGLPAQFASANLDPAVNNWRNVYDFNKGEEIKGNVEHWVLADAPFFAPDSPWEIVPEGCAQPTPADRCAVPGASVAQAVSGSGTAFDAAAQPPVPDAPAEMAADFFGGGAEQPPLPPVPAAPAEMAADFFGGGAEQPPPPPLDAGFGGPTNPPAECAAQADWRAANARKLAEREAAERAEAESTREAARKVLESNKQERARKIEQMRKNNREAESISSAEQAGVANDGNVWGAVVKLLGGENEKLAKMRSLIVRLKHLNKPPLL